MAEVSSRWLFLFQPFAARLWSSRIEKSKCSSSFRQFLRRSAVCLIEASGCDTAQPRRSKTRADYLEAVLLQAVFQHFFAERVAVDAQLRCGLQLHAVTGREHL